MKWWAQNGHLGVVQRFVSFLREVAVVEVSEPIVIFIDEIDTTLSLSFSDDYFAAIRSLYIQRSTDDNLDRLTFVLLGVASPSDLIKDATRTPFNVGTRIPLTDFADSEAVALLPGPGADGRRCIAAAEASAPLDRRASVPDAEGLPGRPAWAASGPWDRADLAPAVDDLMRDLFFSEVGRNTDSNLQFVRDRILESPRVKELLRLYRQIRANLGSTDDELDPLRAALKLTGLVKVIDGGLLQVRNRIYEGVFDDVWIAATLGQEDIEAPQDKGPLGWLVGLFGKKAPSRFKYDAFVSYSREDAKWVQGVLLPTLESAKLRTFIDRADIQAG